MNYADFGLGTWHPKGGHLEFNEMLDGCAKREVMEEIGLDVVATVLADDPADHRCQRFHILLDVSAARQNASPCRALRKDRHAALGRIPAAMCAAL